MKALIVQGPGYYGVNVRLITEVAAEDLILTLGQEQRVDEEFYPRPLILDKEDNPDGSTVFVTDTPIGSIALGGDTLTKSFGFDTGWWDQGEAIINKLLEG